MITIHGVFGSPFIRALRIALDEKSLPWAWQPYQLGEHKQRPYLDLHPFGKIPAIDDDGFILYETQAMLRHIERKRAEPSLIPKDPHQAARMDQLLTITDCYMFPNVSGPIGFNRIIAPRIGMPVNEARIQEAVPHAKTTLDAIAGLHQGGPFLVGGALSLADVALIPHLDWLEMTPEGATAMHGHAGLMGWLQAMRARRSVQDSARSPEKILAAA